MGRENTPQEYFTHTHSPSFLRGSQTQSLGLWLCFFPWACCCLFWYFLPANIPFPYLKPHIHVNKQTGMHMLPRLHSQTHRQARRRLLWTPGDEAGLPDSPSVTLAPVTVPHTHTGCPRKIEQKNEGRHMCPCRWIHIDRCASLHTCTLSESHVGAFPCTRVLTHTLTLGKPRRWG